MSVRLVFRAVCRKPWDGSHTPPTARLSRVPGARRMAFPANSPRNDGPFIDLTGRAPDPMTN